MAQGSIVGYQIFSVDGPVVASGIPVAIYGMNVVSGGGGGPVVLRNGTSASSTAFIHEMGNANSSESFAYTVGIVFPAGCFVDVDADVTQVTIFYEKVGG